MVKFLRFRLRVRVSLYIVGSWQSAGLCFSACCFLRGPSEK